MEIRSATILGSGNVAFHLGKALVQNGIRIDAVYGRNQNHADELANQLHAKAYADISLLSSASDIYIICVKDTAIEEVSNQLPKVAGMVVHTSGNTSMEALWKHKRRGVLYPLQTISKNNSVDFKNVPLLLETKLEEDIEALKFLAKAFEAKLYIVDSEQRKIVHLAAVFANNFTNHLYSIAQQILKANNLSFDMLKPLIHETAHNIENHLPHEVQTGPAVRGDQSTIDKHLKLLNEMPEYKEIYALLSKGIQSKGGL